MLILITGASGKTGGAILRRLRALAPQARIRAVVHRPGQIAAALAAGAAEALACDLLDGAALQPAYAGVDVVYHIAPNMHPQEVEIIRLGLALAKSARVKRFVYHSVLHPQVEAMPHHWNKMRAEECLINSGVDFTILQPCAYMQNLQGYWEAIRKTGVYELPYRPETRISVVDLEDVAEAAARVLTQDGHSAAVYELAGPQALSQAEAAWLIGCAIERPVEARALDRAEWERRARAAGMADYAVKTLLAMFEYYEKCNFIGNANILEWLLGRKPATYAEYLLRLAAEG